MLLPLVPAPPPMLYEFPELLERGDEGQESGDKEGNIVFPPVRSPAAASKSQLEGNKGALEEGRGRDSGKGMERDLTLSAALNEAGTSLSAGAAFICAARCCASFMHSVMVSSIASSGCLLRFSFCFTST